MSLESALEEERLEILKLLESNKPAEPQLPPFSDSRSNDASSRLNRSRHARTSRSVSPFRSSGLRSDHSQAGSSVTGASNLGSANGNNIASLGGMITPSTLVKNFNSLSPAAQDLLLSSSSVPELIAQARAQGPKSSNQQGRRPSTGSIPHGLSSSMLLPNTGPELAPYPTISTGYQPNLSQSNHPRSSSFDGGALRRYKSAEDSRVPYLSNSGPNSPSLSPVSSNTPLSPTISAGSRSQSPIASRSGPLVPQEPKSDFSTAYRRLSDAALLKSGGKLAALASKKSPSSDARLQKDEDDEDAIESSSSDDDDNEDDSDDSDLDESSPVPNNDRPPQSLLAAMEQERKQVSSAKKYHVQSLLSAPPPSHIDNSYRRHLIRPKTAFDLVEDANKSFNSPYTSDTEEAIDIRKAVNLPIKVSDIETNFAAARVLQTITRGDFPQIRENPEIKKRSYIVATDSSPESLYALEWTIGTILRDGNILYAVNAIEEPDDAQVTSPQASTFPTSDDLPANKLESERITAAKEISSIIIKLLKKTRLQVECVIEVMHCKSPKHLICDVIDYLNPTMVVLGSRGRSALKGVLLGSFSNYLVTKSSVPVMVARKKLKKSKHGSSSLPTKFSNNLREGVSGLSLAKVD
ncbi:hypothetical protein V1514DRAFT_328426 [Lipomyces japonicus]|uniref:uncharacterized protein n=1 Tax=Lipomyces japonicus TaxID=56871 RepID=UPI0034CFDEF6